MYFRAFQMMEKGEDRERTVDQIENN
jgi:hypothetical protein